MTKLCHGPSFKNPALSPMLLLLLATTKEFNLLLFSSCLSNMWDITIVFAIDQDDLELE
jgi:hypothetical protein